MNGGKILDKIEMVLGPTDDTASDSLCVHIDVYDNSLSRKWLLALNNLITNNYHLEKNYCFVGFAKHKRNAEFICNKINESINAINTANLGYIINDNFTVGNTTTYVISNGVNAISILHDRLNRLHRYFEDLQGVSGNMSKYYTNSSPTIKWHIRQLNLLCHEYETLILSMKKEVSAPEWQRPSQLMCWLNAPRFLLDVEDYDLFGIDGLYKTQGGVYVGVNKAVGKHHWEVFKDEGGDSRLHELTTTTMKSQTEASGDFDIEWANDTKGHPWMTSEVEEFKEWLINNNFNPNDKSLTIGHPQVGQVDLIKSFGTTQYFSVWENLVNRLNVLSIKTSDSFATYKYNWTDVDYAQQQIERLS